VALTFPVIDNDELARSSTSTGRRPAGLRHRPGSAGLYPVAGGGPATAQRPRRHLRRGLRGGAAGARFIVLSDRDSDAVWAPIPSPAAHRGRAPPPDPREDAHPGRSRRRGRRRPRGAPRRAAHRLRRLAVNPYLAMESVEDLAARGLVPVEPEQAVRNLIKALGKGVLKVMSKMGISTVASYHGAQVFEAVGPRPRARGPLLHRDVEQARRHRARGGRGGGRPPARGRLPAQRGPAEPPHPRRRR
jgi:glutamate synthase (NADPH/NADH) large chain